VGRFTKRLAESLWFKKYFGGMSMGMTNEQLKDQNNIDLLEEASCKLHYVRKKKLVKWTDSDESLFQRINAELGRRIKDYEEKYD
jgi:hypothetical protein